jgi:hypothetical protein
MADLTFVPSEELVKELESRHDATLNIRQDSKHGNNYRVTDYTGGVPTCIGLAVLFIYHALTEGIEDDDGSTEV